MTATMTTSAKADRIAINRAPRGGAVSPVNGLFYAGGQFMPLAPAEFKPGLAALMGSFRQVAWANRLRREAIARLDEEIATRRLFLFDRDPVDVAGVRQAIRRDSLARHRLMVERSAGSIIERRAALVS